MHGSVVVDSQELAMALAVVEAAQEVDAFYRKPIPGGGEMRLRKLSDALDALHTPDSAEEPESE